MLLHALLTYYSCKSNLELELLLELELELLELELELLELLLDLLLDLLLVPQLPQLPQHLSQFDGASVAWRSASAVQSSCRKGR